MSSFDGNNKVVKFTRRNDVMEEASVWLIRLDKGDLDEKGICELQDWMERSPFHRQFLEKLAANWENMSVLNDLAELFPLGEQVFSVRPIEKRRSLFFNWRTVGASLACCFVLGLIVLLKPSFWDWQLQEYSTQVGERKTHILSDGSVIILNTDSKIHVDYGGDRRVIRLLRGEASFDVAKNPNRPFVVYVGQGMVWAVGTAFNVRYDRLRVDVTVTEGTIKVYAEASHYNPVSSLEPFLLATAPIAELTEVIATEGQAVSFDNVIRSHKREPEQELERRLAWQKGGLIFNGEPLEEVVKELSRYMLVPIIITDPSIRSIPVGGTFQLDNTEELLEVLAQGFDLDIVRDIEGKVLLSNKSK